MRSILTALLLLPVAGFAQQNLIASAAGGNSSSASSHAHMPEASVSGFIDLPALMTIGVTGMNSQPLSFNSLDDYQAGKQLNSFVNINVKSNRPWLLNVMSDGVASNAGQISASGRTLTPGMFSIKPNNTFRYVELNSTPQMLMKSSNNNIENNYTMDLRVKPEYGIPGGDYTTNIVFIITQQ